MGAREPAAILEEYAKLTGYPEMPPLWSLGYQQSHRTLASREEILQEAKTFREKKLPCDTLIYLGTGFCPSGWNTDNGEFAFNKKVFPDPPEMLRELHARSFQGGAARRSRRPHADRFGQRSMHRAAAAEREGATASGPTIARCPVTGPCTSRFSISASTAGGRTRAMVSTDPRASRESACTGTALARRGRTSGPSRCTGMDIPACSATRRFSGRATCIRRGKR